MFFFRILILLSLCFKLNAFGNPYENFIASIASDGSKVTLDNGFTWDVVVPLIGGDDRKYVKQWALGDEVAMRINPVDGAGNPRIYFYLKNLRTLTTAWVRYTEQKNDWYALTVDKIDNEGNVTLSDGSLWGSTCLPESTSYWNVGEHVLVYRNKRYVKSYILVNPDFGLQPPSWWRTNYYYSGVFATLQN